MPNVELEPLKRKRGAIKAKVTAFSKFVHEVQKTIAESEDNEIKEAKRIELNLRFKKIENIGEEFEKIQDEIENVADDFEEQLKERETFETTLYSILALAVQLLKTKEDHIPDNMSVISEHSVQSNSSIQQNNSNSGANVKLPQIKLPTFKGEYEHWLEFRDTFKALIHENEKITDIEKFHYLRAALQESAAQVILSIELSAGNYQTAWEVLCERYNNMSLLLHTHVSSLFELPTITKESAHELRNLIDRLSKNLRALKILEQPTEYWDVLVIHIVTKKLDSKTLREWQEKKKDKASSTLEELKTFLRHKADVLETVEFNRNEGKFKGQPQRARAFLVTSNHRCGLCKEEHKLFNCEQFLKLSPQARYNEARKLKLCINCLNSGHMAKDCKYGQCKKCSANHNTLLHISRDTQDKEVKSNTETREVALTSHMINTPNHKKHIILSTALIQITGATGKSQVCRALLDSGAQSNFISAEICKILKLQTSQVKAEISGINNVSLNINKKCEISIQSLHNAYDQTISCLVLDEVTDEVPNEPLDVSNIRIPSYIKLADPKYYEPGKIDIIIGAGIFWNLICIGQHRIKEESLMLQKTVLGWIMTGSLGVFQEYKNVRCNFAKNINIQSQLEKFWNVEEVRPQKIWTAEEQECEDIFQKTVKKAENGRFIVTIPLKESPIKLGDSRQIALRRYQALEKKLERNQQLRKEYTRFIKEYEELGHMTRMSPSETTNCNYLPHHGVVNESSTTTRLRVVFDGSMKTESGVSFNDLQHVGPTVQEDLFSILLRFRQHTYVVCADIKKMYRQILIEAEQRKLQCILWRDNTSQEIHTFKLNTVTYGTSSAPYLATRCLKQLATENHERYPDAAKIIESDFYVDDMLTGKNTVQELKQAIAEVTHILASAGMELQKWISNNKEILTTIQQTQPECLSLGKNEHNKTLGIYWSNQKDELGYNIPTQENSQSITKRTILSQIAQIFDPLGLVSPCIITAKLMLQRLWKLNLSWDESVPQEVFAKWTLFRKELGHINNLQISRHVICKEAKLIELHGFADASQEAYGACVYVRSKNQNGEIETHLLTAKTRVAPVKILTIPRLELCAAVVLSQLIQRIRNALTIEIHRIYLWSDSTVVLHWLNTDPGNLQPFVSHRVIQIQESTKVKEWKHINTSENPADLLSRGLTPKQLINNKLWWKGPKWLSAGKERWPESNLEFLENPPEMKKNLKLFIATKINIDLLTCRCSSFRKLNRVMAYCKRFISNCKLTKEHRNTGSITISELNIALKCLIKLDQQQSFPKEIAELQSSQHVTKKSQVLRLNPILDEEGIMRVGGRLQNSELEFQKKHPAILGKTDLTRLLIIHEHERLSHAGPQHTLSSLREKYWPISGRNQVKKITRTCIRCFKTDPKTKVPIMGALPAARVRQSFPFQNTGVDYAGPFYLKNRDGRGCKVYKAYICLFVCLSTKALHLELVSDLSKAAFIATFKRFIARRGRPNQMYSDNGTNFTAANKELSELFTNLRKMESEISEYMVNEGITWNFIPARAPHFGGLWEAGVRAVKLHLRKIIGETKLTFEQFNTVLTQVEAILNSRPLTPLSNDPNEFDALTPSHFLIGRRLTALPEDNVITIQENRLTKFRHLQKMQQLFWRKWQQDYLTELQVRVKWNKHQTVLQEGMMVLIKEENLPPLRWALGRIEQVIPGVDGIARVAVIRTRNGLVKRAFSKICTLPIEEKGESVQ